jgi:hypothetical protein
LELAARVRRGIDTGAHRVRSSEGSAVVRGLGILLLIVAVVIGLYALSMKTTVETEGAWIGEQYIGGGEVYNVGLLDQRRNTLLVAGVLAVVGGLLVVAGGRGIARVSSMPGAGERKCPQCAEFVKREASVCRYCGYDLSGVLAAELEQTHRANRVAEAERQRRQSELDQARLRRRSEREAWRLGHPRTGWLPIRNRVQVWMIAVLLVVALGVLVGFGLSLAPRSKTGGLLEGTWRPRLREYSLSFSPGAWSGTHGSVSMVLPRANGYTQIADAEYRVVGPNRLEITDYAGISARYEIRFEGDVLILTINSIRAGSESVSHYEAQQAYPNSVTFMAARSYTR